MKTASRVSYALGDFGINLYFMSTLSFLAFFYTDYYGLSASVVAGVFLVARIIDAVTDPIMGYVADHTRTRFGRFRPYLLYGALPLGAIAVATFTIPNFDTFGKIVWAYVTYTIFGIIYTVVTLPYAAMTGVLTHNSQERATISTLRMGGAFAGGWLVSVVMLDIVGFFGGGSIGFQSSMILFSCIATVLLWITFIGTKELPDLKPPVHELAPAKILKTIAQNPPLWVVIILFVLGMLAFTFRQTATPYYFTYNMGRPDLIGTYFFTTLGVMMLGLFAIPTLTKLLGKPGTIRVGAIVSIVGATAFYFTDPSNVVGVFFFGSLIALGGAPIAVLGWAMIPDTVEFAQWKQKIRADGIIFSIATFFQKLGKAVGGAAVAGILGITGYIANQEQTPVVLHAILIAMSIIPLVVNVLLIIASFFYKISASRHAALVRLIQREQDQKPQLYVNR